MPGGGGGTAAHASRHQDGGSDEISVASLSGALADAQTPAAHKASHQDAGADEISILGLAGDAADAQDPKAHASSHQNGGADEVDATGLTGVGVSLTQGSAASTADQNITTMDTYVDVTTLTLTLAAGKWVIVANLDILWYDSITSHLINIKFLEGATSRVTMTYMNDRGSTDFRHGYMIGYTANLASSTVVKVQIQTVTISGNKYVRVMTGSSIYALGG